MKTSVSLEQCMLDRPSPASPATAAALPIVGTKNGNGVWQRIISEMPPHRVYIEPFWGRGSIARRKRPAEITVGCDLDPLAIESGLDLATMFQVNALHFLAGYFPLGFKDACRQSLRDPAATFGGYPWRDHFVYLDPPYLIDRNYYAVSFDEEDHLRLLAIFRALPCPAAISGYWNDLYADELRGMRHIEIPTVNRGCKPVTEILWCNFAEPAELHDARFIGRDRRERERIRRRVSNWKDNFAAMPPVERQLLLETLSAAHADGSSPDSQLPPQRHAARS